MSTDISTPAFDPGDFLQRWTEYEKRAADLHPANKASLFAALRDAGITTVVVTFDGYGDSGQIESIEARSGDDLADVPATPVEIARLDFHAIEPERLTEPLGEAIETLAYAFLEQTHGGWENNGGAFGEFVFDVAGETITLDYNERIETSENYTHEY